MTPLQKLQATALLPLLPPGKSDARRLVSRWAFNATEAPLATMPDLDAVRLGELVHRYRDRLSEEQHRELCGVCRGSEPLFGDLRSEGQVAIKGERS